MVKSYLVAVVAVIVLTGCGGKEMDEFNKPSEYWYEQMVNAVSNGNLEKADSYFSSLQSEHISSPFLSEATMIMAQAHMAQDEYVLAEHFLNEYIRRYATPQGREYAEFLKIKAKFLALPYTGRDQGMIDETLSAVDTFKASYPESNYLVLVKSMETQLHMAKRELNEQIAQLYDRLGKPKGAEYYRTLSPTKWINASDVEKANTPWYREPFEGDGTSSWYAFMIPDTQSVISMDDNVSVIVPKSQKSGSWYDFLIPSF